MKTFFSVLSIFKDLFGLVRAENADASCKNISHILQLPLKLLLKCASMEKPLKIFSEQNKIALSGNTRTYFQIADDSSAGKMWQEYFYLILRTQHLFVFIFMFPPPVFLRGKFQNVFLLMVLFTFFFLLLFQFRLESFVLIDSVIFRENACDIERIR